MLRLEVAALRYAPSIFIAQALTVMKAVFAPEKS
jgi:hypothetical protein